MQRAQRVEPPVRVLQHMQLARSRVVFEWRPVPVAARVGQVLAARQMVGLIRQPECRERTWLEPERLALIGEGSVRVCTVAGALDELVVVDEQRVVADRVAVRGGPGDGVAPGAELV